MPVVTLAKEGKVGIIQLNRPPANSYNKEFLDDLNAAIDQLRFDEDLKVAVVASELPKFFSAGADVAWFNSSTLGQKVAFVTHANEVFSKFERTHKPVIAAIAGHALGGGLELALCCDLRFAAEGEYRIGLPEVTLGLLPGTGGTQRLPRLINRARALDLMLTGEPLNPRQALELGLVDRLYPADELLNKTLEYASKLAAGPAYAVGNIKLATVQGLMTDLNAGLALEREMVYRLFDSEDGAEGIRAFAERRQPRFTGKTG